MTHFYDSLCCNNRLKLATYVVIKEPGNAIVEWTLKELNEPGNVIVEWTLKELNEPGNVIVEWTLKELNELGLKEECDESSLTKK